MKYKNLSSFCQYQTERTDIVNLSTDNYISTENMLPNCMGVTAAESLPQGKTCCGYSPQNILISNIRLYFKKIWYATKSGGCSNDVLVLAVNKDVNPLFLYYALSDSNFFNYADVTSKGTKMPRGSKSAIMKYLIPDMDITTQNTIASILSTYDSLIENNTRRIKILEAMAENLYKEWFVRFRFPGHEQVKIVNGVPEGWCLLKIKDITQLKSGYAFKSEWFINAGCCIAKIKDVGNIIMDTSDFSFVAEENCIRAKKFILNEGDLTIALTGATIGKIGIVPRYNRTIYTNQRLGKFFNGQNPIEKLPFLYCLFSQQSTISMIQNISNSSSAQPNISPEQIENIKFIGNIRLITEFNSYVMPLFKEILNLHTKNQNLTKQRDLLLPRLMSGKIDIQNEAEA